MRGSELRSQGQRICIQGYGSRFGGTKDFGLRIQDLGFRVQGQGSGFRVQGSGFKV